MTMVGQVGRVTCSMEDPGWQTMGRHKLIKATVEFQRRDQTSNHKPKEIGQWRLRKPGVGQIHIIEKARAADLIHHLQQMFEAGGDTCNNVAVTTA